MPGWLPHQSVHCSRVTCIEVPEKSHHQRLPAASVSRCQPGPRRAAGCQTGTGCSQPGSVACCATEKAHAGTRIRDTLFTACATHSTSSEPLPCCSYVQSLVQYLLASSSSLASHLIPARAGTNVPAARVPQKELRPLPCCVQLKSLRLAGVHKAQHKPCAAKRRGHGPLCTAWVNPVLNTMLLHFTVYPAPGHLQ